MIFPLKERSSKKESTFTPSRAILISLSRALQLEKSGLLKVILISESLGFIPVEGVTEVIFGRSISFTETVSA